MSINIIIWLFGIIYILACLFLVMVVLLQEGKSGGMGGAESVSQAPGALQETFGAGGAQRGLFKVTSWTAVIFFVLALALTLLGNRKEQTGGNLQLGEEAQVQQTEGTTADEPLAPIPESTE